MISKFHILSRLWWKIFIRLWTDQEKWWHRCLKKAAFLSQTSYGQRTCCFSLVMNGKRSGQHFHPFSHRAKWKLWCLSFKQSMKDLLKVLTKLQSLEKSWSWKISLASSVWMSLLHVLLDWMPNPLPIRILSSSRMPGIFLGDLLQIWSGWQCCSFLEGLYLWKNWAFRWISLIPQCFFIRQSRKHWITGKKMNKICFSCTVYNNIYFLKSVEWRQRLEEMTWLTWCWMS